MNPNKTKNFKKFAISITLVFSVMFFLACNNESDLPAAENQEAEQQESVELIEIDTESDDIYEVEESQGIEGLTETAEQNTDNNVDNINFSSPHNFTYPDAVRGIYVTSHSAGGARMERLIDLLDSTQLNAMVIDIKDDHGYITFPLEETHPYHKYSRRNISDPKAMMERLEASDIYPIARIVVFKDSVIVNDRPEWSFLENGTVWKNRRGEAFVNPFLEEVWEYNVDIAKMAAELGFKEIQFDYVRFPEGFENRDESLEYSRGEYADKTPQKWYELKEQYELDIVIHQKMILELQNDLILAEVEKNRAETLYLIALQNIGADANETKKAKSDFDELAKKYSVINNDIKKMIDNTPKEPELSRQERNVQLRVDSVTDFVEYAKNELKPYGVEISVDIFGYTATLPEAPGIGQNFTRISEQVDVICSMIYPSHWGFNYFGIPKPDLEPYRLVKEYIIRENEKLSAMENPPVSRPWIQDFTASYLGRSNFIKYGKYEVEAQIKALNEHGVWEFLLWNAGNSYSEGVNYIPLGAPPAEHRQDIR